MIHIPASAHPYGKPQAHGGALCLWRWQLSSHAFPLQPIQPTP